MRGRSISVLALTTRCGYISLRNLDSELPKRSIVVGPFAVYFSCGGVQVRKAHVGNTEKSSEADYQNVGKSIGIYSDALHAFYIPHNSFGHEVLPISLTRISPTKELRGYFTRQEKSGKIRYPSTVTTNKKHLFFGGGKR